MPGNLWVPSGEKFRKFSWGHYMAPGDSIFLCKANEPYYKSFLSGGSKAHLQRAELREKVTYYLIS
jgi:hypothetical protein